MSLDFNSILSNRLKDCPNDLAYTFLTNHTESSDYTYQNLHNEVNPIANYLNSISVKQPILLLFSPSLKFIKALLACLCSGNIAVPIAIPKPAEKNKLSQIVENSGAKIILSESALIDVHQANNKQLNWIDVDYIVNIDNRQLPSPSSSDIAILQYTSGSTGQPKGVMVSYENLNHNLKAIKDHFGITKKSVSFSWLPHYHDMGLIDGILLPLISGCTAILTSPKQVIGRPDFWFDCITKYGVTHTGGPNFLYDLCIEKATNNTQWNLSTITDLYTSAEPVRIQTLRNFTKKFKSIGFDQEKFTPGFGLAEGTLMVSCQKSNIPIKTRKIKFQTYEIEAVSLGVAISGMNIKIVNPETAELIKGSEPGEIWLNGTSVTQGYWNKPNQTAVTYNGIMKGSDERFLRTGDLGILHEGELYVVGRLKDTIILNGFNYHAEDIEYAISRSHDAIRNDASLAFTIETGTSEELVILIKVSPQVKNIIAEMEHVVRKTLYHQFGISKATINFHTGVAYTKTTSGKIMRFYNKKRYVENQFNLLSAVK